MKHLDWKRLPSLNGATATTNPGQAQNGRLGIAPRNERTARPSLRQHRLLQPVPLAGFALMLIGLLIVFGYSAAAGKRSSVLIAAHDLPAGTQLTASDLRSARIGADRQVLASMLPLAEQSTVIGRRLTTSVAAGEPLSGSSLAPRSQAPPALTLALPTANAVGGELEPADHVTVLATFSTRNGGASARVIARDLLVLAVNEPSSTTLSDDASTSVTVAVPDETLVTQLALANTVGKIDLVRESPRPNATPIPAATAQAQTP